MIQNDIFERTKSDLIENFKNKANSWQKNKLTNEEILHEIEILIESGLIEISGVKQDSFNQFEFIIPQWVKKLVNFWFENYISDQE